MVTDFWRESAKFAYPIFILCAGIHNGSEDRNKFTRMHALIPSMTV